MILLGDALVAGCNAAKEMAALSAANGGASVVGLEHVPPEKVSRYGIVKLEDGRVIDMVEKPRLEEAPSDLAIAGRYLLSTKIFDYLQTQAPGKGGEIQLTDAIKRLIRDSRESANLTNRTIEQSDQSNNLLGYIYPGKRQDIGNPDGYLQALLAMKEG